MSAPETVKANFSPLTTITVQTSPPGLQFSMDGGLAQTAPQTTTLAPGTHIIAVTTAQAGATGTQYAYTGWSDGGAASHSITVGTASATYTATFQTQYQLTISPSLSAGGTVTPASGTFYNPGTIVPIVAAANAGYTFNGWSGTVASAANASTTVTMSAPETVTANFSSLPGTTIQTSPPGLQFTVDGGAALTAPQTLNLAAGTHYLSVAATQAGPAGVQYLFNSWSDNGAVFHGITVGTASAIYTATFQAQYPLTISAFPVAGGTVTPATGTLFTSGTTVPIVATANAGYTFSGWSGTVASATSASTKVIMSAPETVTANFSLSPGITIQTSPPGLQFSVDGGAAQTAPQTLNLAAGTHTIAVATTQAGGSGTQYAFASWSDGGAASHGITVGSSAAIYTATFNTLYQLTISASPLAGGTVTPASGTFYNSGTAVPITATANSGDGYSFSGWTGTVASATSASTTVTMSAPETVVANFTSGQAPSAVTTFSPAQGATGISPATSLVWGAASGATSYDVYFGTSTPPPLLATTTTTSYSPSMSGGVTYYWMITAKNASGSTPSAVWSFTTAAGLRPGCGSCRLHPAG